MNPRFLKIIAALLVPLISLEPAAAAGFSTIHLSPLSSPAALPSAIPFKQEAFASAAAWNTPDILSRRSIPSFVRRLLSPAEDVLVPGAVDLSLWRAFSRTDISRNANAPVWIGLVEAAGLWAVSFALGFATLSRDQPLNSFEDVMIKVIGVPFLVFLAHLFIGTLRADGTSGISARDAFKATAVASLSAFGGFLSFYAATFGSSSLEQVLVASAGVAFALFHPAINALLVDNRRVGVGVIIGGTKIEIHIVRPEGLSGNAWDKEVFTWDEFRQAMGTQDVADKQEEFVEFLSQKIAQLLKKRKLGMYSNLEKIGISFAGPVSDDQRVHGTNMPVHFREFDLPLYLRTSSSLPAVESITVLNDGAAGLAGEQHDPRGALRPERLRPGQKPAYFIWGTGFGASGAGIWEAGHLIVRDAETGRYELKTREEMFEEGVGFRLLPGYTQLEHRIAGPWAAIRFIKETSMDLTELAAAIQVDISELEKLQRLHPRTMDSWSQQIPGDVALAISKFIHASRHSDTSLGRAAREFELSLYRELGDALRVVRENFGDVRAVLGSSMAEIRRDDPDFLRIVREASGSNEQQVVISDLDASREAVGAAHIPLRRPKAVQKDEDDGTPRSGFSLWNFFRRPGAPPFGPLRRSIIRVAAAA
jgi:hypothetical protein